MTVVTRLVGLDLFPGPCMQQVLNKCRHDYYFVFSGTHPWNMEVLRLGVGLELQLLAYTIAHGNAGYLTHLARPGIKPATSWFLVRMDFAAPKKELPSETLELKGTVEKLNLKRKGCANSRFYMGCCSCSPYKFILKVQSLGADGVRCLVQTLDEH